MLRSRATLLAAFTLCVAALASTGQAATYGISQFADAVLSGQSSGNYQRIKLFRDSTAAENAGFNATYGNGPEGGGEFYIQWNSGGTWGVVHDDELAAYVKTFCLEKGETFEIGKEYSVTIDANAIWGHNVNASAAGDPLENRTKILYGLYADGLLDVAQNASNQSSGFQFQNNAWANAVQYGIWNLEDSHPLNANAQQLLNWLASLGSNGYDRYLNNVKALNVWVPGKEYTYEGRKQSQAIFVPAPDGQIEPVPEPASVALWTLLGSLACAGHRLRRRSR